MERTVDTKDFCKSANELVTKVREDGDSYVIEQSGEKEAALVPVHIYENFKANRRRLFEMMEEASSRLAVKSGEEIDASIERAIEEVRQERRNKRGQSEA